jgi:BirA family biotin operon repressor/biotin-[acetyl-CoA-carboxylase] ligase
VSDQVEGSFPLTRAESTEFVQVATTGSTNDDLVALAPSSPDWAVRVCLDQTAGRGRLDRRWSAPAGQMLAASVLIRPRLSTGESLPQEDWGWFPLLAGLALKAVLESALPADRNVALKWPNDVQVNGRKISGILGALCFEDGRPDAVVMGLGLNLTIAESDLPTPTSTSLRLEGLAGDADALADQILSDFVLRLRQVIESTVRHGGVARVPGLVGEVAERCDTVGRRVRVELPGGDNAYGIATGLDGAGRLIVLQDDNRGELTVAAGDVTHLRYE